MSNSILKSIIQVLKSISAKIPTDYIYVFAVSLLFSVFLVCVALKAASQSADTYCASKKVCKYFENAKIATFGTVSFLMKCFPKPIVDAWQRHLSDTDSKPSNYLEVELVPVNTSADNVALYVQRLVSAIVLFASALLTLVNSNLPFSDSLIFILSLIVIALILLSLTTLIYTIVDTLATYHFNVTIRKLNLFHFSKKDYGKKTFVQSTPTYEKLVDKINTPCEEKPVLSTQTPPEKDCPVTPIA